MVEHDYGTAGYLVNHPDTNVFKNRQSSLYSTNVKGISVSPFQQVRSDRYIRRLRRKIEDDPNSPTKLLTEIGFGYKWAGK